MKGRGDTRPVLAITGGDPNGIGPEICLKALLSRAVRTACRPVLVGHPAVFEYYRRRFRLPISLNETAPDTVPRGDGGIPVIAVKPAGAFRPTPGRAGKSAGLIAGRSVETAVTLCRRGVVDGMVTGPLAKDTLNEAGFRFQGQTEMISKLSKSGPPLMIMMNDDIRVALVTIHIPLRRVSTLLSVGAVSRAVRILHASLRRDFRISRPAIAVLGLNPHAGEGGLTGTEERAVIGPALRSLDRAGIRASGPFPADGFFAGRSRESFDGIVAMYHDQGLIPLKMSGIATVVNFTAGLEVVRTSPGHGTAFDIAGRGIADPSSMIAAVLSAVRVIRNRRRPAPERIRR
ncbi:MAG TPA: 4-hydroxythreonine-4-phosphate dehydrogenase PdxA [Bacteroidota bacterium]|nr:4-hydroxythreonine-4-phosphate dehydrogenase PdxA [Bacteroidota bacterium]